MSSVILTQSQGGTEIITRDFCCKSAKWNGDGRLLVCGLATAFGSACSNSSLSRTTDDNDHDTLPAIFSHCSQWLTTPAQGRHSLFYCFPWGEFGELFINCAGTSRNGGGRRTYVHVERSGQKRTLGEW